jgi:Protein of unknown function (DUF551)
MPADNEALILETLRRASDLIREAAQMALLPYAPPEEAVRFVRALTMRALMPKIAAMEFVRLGGTNTDVFADILAGPPWLPIECAPKNGTYVLIWYNTEASCGHAIVRWGGREWEDNECYTYEPTHWMLLPDAPE